MLSYDVSAYVLAGFLFAYAVFFFFVSIKEPLPEKKGLGRVWNLKMILLLMAFVFFSLSQLNIYVGFGLNLQQDTFGDCEYVPANATVVGNVTSYSFANTCSAADAPQTTSTMFTVLLYLAFLEIILIFLGTLFVTARAMTGW